MCELGLYDDDGRLPSCRELALSIGVNPNTVQRAYSQLEAEGDISALPKKGYYATEVKSSRESAAADKIREIKAAGFTKGELIKIIDGIYGGSDD